MTDTVDDLGSMTADDILGQALDYSRAAVTHGMVPFEEPPTPVAEEPAPAGEEPAPPVAEEPPPAVEEPPAEPPKKEHMIPKSRLDQEISKRRIQQQRADELEQQLAQIRQQPADQFSLTLDTTPATAEMMQKYHDAILDGKHEEAAKIIQEIRLADMNATAAALHAQMRKEQEALAAQIKQELTREQQTAQLQALITEIETEFPVLNAASEDYDATLAAEVLAMHQYFVARGYAPTDAMTRAAATVLQMNRPDLLAPQPTPAAPAAPAPAAAVVQQRQVQQQQKVVQLARQPIATPQQAAIPPSTSIDVMSLSDEEFAALPESKLRELRGDYAR